MMQKAATISEQLNSDAREIVIMPEQTLLKVLEEILEKKLEQDERKYSSTANESSMVFNLSGKG